MEQLPFLMTLGEVHRLVGHTRVGRDALYAVARRYGVKLGKRYLFPRRVVEALLEGRLDELDKNPAGQGGDK